MTIADKVTMSIRRRASIAGLDFKKDYLNRSGDR